MADPKNILETHTPNGNPFASFAWFPPRVQFATQEKKEYVVLLLRRHPITNLGWIVTALILLILPGLLIVFRDSLNIKDLLAELSLDSLTVFLLMWYLFVLGYIFNQFLNWYFNVFLITNKRVVDVDFMGVLYKHISEAELDKIQDVTHQMVGSMEVLFDYGDLTIQTAAEFSDIKFEKIPNPGEVHKIIGELLQKY